MNVLQEVLNSLQEIFNVLLQFLTTTPALRTALDILILVVPWALLLAFSGMGFLAATARILVVKRKRVAYEKCSRQLAFLGMILGWGLLIGSRVWIYFQGGQFEPESAAFYLVEMSWLLFSLAVLLSSVFFVLWRLLKNMPILHMTIGIITALQSCVALASALITARFLAAIAHPDAATIDMGQIFPMDWQAPFWSAIVYTLPMLFVMPAGLGAFWLVLRRKHEDFGRDYYNMMIPWCASWARNAWTVLWLILIVSAGLQIWQGWKGGAFSQEEAILESSRVLLWLIPALLWTIVCRSSIALRHKLTLFLALCMAAGFTLPWYLELTRI